MENENECFYDKELIESLIVEFQNRISKYKLNEYEKYGIFFRLIETLDNLSGYKGVLN